MYSFDSILAEYRSQRAILLHAIPESGVFSCLLSINHVIFRQLSLQLVTQWKVLMNIKELMHIRPVFIVSAGLYVGAAAGLAAGTVLLAESPDAELDTPPPYVHN